jgi:hypothetical protein
MCTRTAEHRRGTLHCFKLAAVLAGCALQHQKVSRFVQLFVVGVVGVRYAEALEFYRRKDLKQGLGRSFLLFRPNYVSGRNAQIAVESDGARHSGRSHLLYPQSVEMQKESAFGRLRTDVGAKMGAQAKCLQSCCHVYVCVFVFYREFRYKQERTE